MLRTVSGHGGYIYLLGPPFRFDLPLRDCGTGWDWQVPDVRLLDPESLDPQLWAGEWIDLPFAEVHSQTARIGFDRCLRGESVRAIGRGCPATVVSSVDEWRLEMTVAIAGRSVLGSGDVHTTVKPTSTSVLAKADVDVAGPVFVELPFGGHSVYAGAGNALPTPEGVRITFNREEIANEPA